MGLSRHIKSVDGTIPVRALLYDDEELLASQDAVGIYDGAQKSSPHQSGIIHATTHRLFYIDAARPAVHSFALDLAQVTQTDHYAGLFKSSPKITLYLDADTPAAPVEENVFASWTCEVCGNKNPPGLSPAAARVCALCGVPRSSVPAPISVPASASPPTLQAQHLSSSLPSSSINLAAAPSPAPTSPSGSSIACSACTFLNHPSLRECEICGTALPPRTAPGASQGASTKSAPSSRPASPTNEASDDAPSGMMKVSFRKGGDKAFYAVLKRALKSKNWLGSAIGKTGASTPNAAQRSGISGILQDVEANAQGTETGMKDALQDLEAFMIKAKDMVRLAAELNDRLTATSTTTSTSTPQIASTAFAPNATPTLVPSTEPEEATFIRSSLSQLGLQMQNAPVTLDMIRDERRWIEELARELAGILQGSGRMGKDVGMMKERGVIALDEVWGGWNRARGVALIPPSTFLQVLPHLPAYTEPPIRSRTFSSGLSVLHTPQYTHASFSSRLAGAITLMGPVTTMDVSRDEGITFGLASELIDAVEGDGIICRDDPSCAIQGGGGGGSDARWWANALKEYVWDGHI